MGGSGQLGDPGAIDAEAEAKANAEAEATKRAAKSLIVHRDTTENVKHKTRINVSIMDQW